MSAPFYINTPPGESATNAPPPSLAPALPLPPVNAPPSPCRAHLRSRRSESLQIEASPTCVREHVHACMRAWTKERGKLGPQVWVFSTPTMRGNVKTNTESGGLASSFVRWEHAVPPGPESSGGGTNPTNGRWPPLPPGFLISPQLPELINTGRIAACTLCFPTFYPPPPRFSSFSCLLLRQ